MMYVYRITQQHGFGHNRPLFTVGYYDPDGIWQPESDHADGELAAERVAWLNGSGAGSFRSFLVEPCRIPENLTHI